MGTYSNLNAEISRANIDVNQIVSIAKITRPTFIKRKKGISDWKLSEMLLIQRYINEKLNTNYTLDYLFKRD